MKVMRKNQESESKNFYDYFEEDEQIVNEALMSLPESRINFLKAVFKGDLHQREKVLMNFETSRFFYNQLAILRKKIKDPNVKLPSSDVRIEFVDGELFVFIIKNQKTFFQYFEGISKKRVLVEVKKLSPDKILLIQKKYGEDFETLTGYEYNKKEQQQFYNIVTRMRDRLIKIPYKKELEIFKLDVENTDIKKHILEIISGEDFERKICEFSLQKLTNLLIKLNANLEARDISKIDCIEIEKAVLVVYKNLICNRLDLLIGSKDFGRNDTKKIVL